MSSIVILQFSNTVFVQRIPRTFSIFSVRFTFVQEWPGLFLPVKMVQLVGALLPASIKMAHFCGAFRFLDFYLQSESQDPCGFSFWDFWICHFIVEVKIHLGWDLQAPQLHFLNFTSEGMAPLLSDCSPPFKQFELFQDPASAKSRPLTVVLRRMGLPVPAELERRLAAW